VKLVMLDAHREDGSKTLPPRPGAVSLPLEPPEANAAPRFRALSNKHLERIVELQALPEEPRFAMRVVAEVLPFRVNRYVIDELIDWRNVPDDPIYQLTFPQRGMLSEEHFDEMASLLRHNAPHATVRAAALRIRAQLNPHPAGQREHNIVKLDGVPLAGLQHKYAETVLFFPSQGQTCHSYCTFCFRWAQFIGDKAIKFASSEIDTLVEYLERNKQVTDVLITGGDPMVMKTKTLEHYVEALLQPDLEHIQNIRIGSKALTFWPHRFVNDGDADDLLRLFDQVVARGKSLAFMAHLNHWRELGTATCRRAVRRIRDTGAVIRAQAPLLKHINDDAKVWARLWRTQVELGIVPYYMFVERDTGARRYFEVPLHRAHEIYRDAIRQVSGLGRTARGPSMSAGPGKVEIQGVTEIAGEKVFALRFIQARKPEWAQRPFFARFDATATWLNQLKPAFGKDRFFFEEDYLQSYGATNVR
jgi:KamA family protein